MRAVCVCVFVCVCKCSTPVFASTLTPLSLLTPSPQPAPIRLAQVCVLGYMGVGKSSLTIQYAEGQFIEAYSPTIENTFQKMVQHRDTECVRCCARAGGCVTRACRYLIEILDTAGQVCVCVCSCVFSRVFFCLCVSLTVLPAAQCT